jgi:predicted metal-dependent hydrolase
VAVEKANVIGKLPRRIRVREVGSCWGSCSHAGDLTFSWRLIFAPPEILEYLISHEVAHLKEMNHSPRFWKVVGKLCPHWKESRAWLRDQGHMLYAYQF